MNRIRWLVMLTIVAGAAALTLGCNVEAAPGGSIKADDATWEFSKTNGFTSEIDSGS